MPRHLWLIYLNANGVAKDEMRAKDYFELAANRGDITGAFYLGECYRLGLGVKTDYQKAREWFEISAKRGDTTSAPAMVSLGIIHELRQGVEAILTTAFKLV